MWGLSKAMCESKERGERRERAGTGGSAGSAGAAASVTKSAKRAGKGGAKAADGEPPQSGAAASKTKVPREEATTSQATRGRNKKDKDEKAEKQQQPQEHAMKDTIKVLLKANLQTSQSNRALAGAVFTTCIIEGACTPASEAIKAGTEYNNKVSELGSGHGLGPPHVFQAQAFMDSLAGLAAPKVGAAKVKKDSYLQEFGIATELMKKADLQTIGETFTYFRCKETYGDDSKYILTFHHQPLRGAGDTGGPRRHAGPNNSDAHQLAQGRLEDDQDHLPGNGRQVRTSAAFELGASDVPTPSASSTRGKRGRRVTDHITADMKATAEEQRRLAMAAEAIIEAELAAIFERPG